ncbi:hypothetical protein OC844_006189 [Tilletia horrida]|nr:hypothetical protein OC844_006189 [Tilletia horrida]
MEAEAFERHPGKRAPVKAQEAKPKQTKAAHGGASSSASSSSSAMPSFSRGPGSGLFIPGQSQSQPLLGQLGRLEPLILPTPPKALPDFTARKGLSLPERSTSRSQSREPRTSSPALSAEALAPAGAIGSSAPGAHSRKSSLSADSPRPSTFDAVVIPIPSSPSHSQLAGTPSSRKRAVSMSQQTPSKRARDEDYSGGMSSSQPQRTGRATEYATSAEGTGQGASGTESQSVDADWQAPPSSQKGRIKAKGKGKAASTAKADGSQFLKPTSLSTFLSTASGDAQRLNDVLAEVRAELQSSKARRKQNASEDHIPAEAKELRSCPFCPNPWPKNPSQRLLELVQPLLDSVLKNGKIDNMQRMGMCSLHNQEAAIIPEGKERGWPTAEELDWTYWERIFFEGGEDREHKWVMKQMCDRVRDPSSSRRLRTLQDKAAREGIRMVTSAKGVLGSMDEEHAGYFGEVGNSKMMEWLHQAFIDQRIPEDNNPYPLENLHLDAANKRASLHPLNSSSFISRCLVPELATCFIKIRERCTMDEAVTIWADSSSYGSAILPLLAEEDVGQFLDFDLEQDEVDAEKHSPPTASQVSNPPTPSRRNPPRQLSANNSPATRSKASPTQVRQQRKSGRDQRSVDEATVRPGPSQGRRSEATDLQQVPPSSMSSTGRPKPRRFQRSISTASTFSRFSSDEESSLPPASQAPSASQPPPASQRPRPRPVQKKRSAAEIGSRKDSDDEVFGSSSRPTMQKRQRSRSPTDTVGGSSQLAPSQTKQSTAGSSDVAPAASASATFGSSQDPIPILSSEDSLDRLMLDSAAEVVGEAIRASSLPNGRDAISADEFLHVTPDDSMPADDLDQPVRRLADPKACANADDIFKGIQDSVQSARQQKFSTSSDSEPLWYSAQNRGKRPPDVEESARKRVPPGWNERSSPIGDSSAQEDSFAGVAHFKQEFHAAENQHQGWATCPTNVPAALASVGPNCSATTSYNRPLRRDSPPLPSFGARYTGFSSASDPTNRPFGNAHQPQTLSLHEQPRLNPKSTFDGQASHGPRRFTLVAQEADDHQSYPHPPPSQEPKRAITFSTSTAVQQFHSNTVNDAVQSSSRSTTASNSFDSGYGEGERAHPPSQSISHEHSALLAASESAPRNILTAGSSRTTSTAASGSESTSRPFAFRPPSMWTEEEHRERQYEAQQGRRWQDD